jgi:hypothetical protein
MTEAFIPLSPATFSTGAPLPQNVPRHPAPATLPIFDPLKTPSDPPAPPAGNCAGAAPAITLQRNGDVVTGIRVQCGCGDVIELNCLY